MEKLLTDKIQFLNHNFNLYIIVIVKTLIEKEFAYSHRIRVTVSRNDYIFYFKKEHLKRIVMGLTADLLLIFSLLIFIE